MNNAASDSTQSDRVPSVHRESLDAGTLAVLTLDDPKRANAMSPEMGDQFAARLREIGNEPGVRVVIICGEGKDFSIGGHRDMLIDLGSGTRTEPQLREFMLAFYKRWLGVLDLPMPVISVLQGDCIGIAPVFACVSDIVVADETLNLQVTFAGLGLYPGMALPSVLVRRIGAQQAALLMMANESISGREAERLGLVARCVPAGKAFGEAVRIARDIVSSESTVVMALKKALGTKREQLLPELEANAAQQARDFQSAEYRRRVANYLPKRS